MIRWLMGLGTGAGLTYLVMSGTPRHAFVVAFIMAVPVTVVIAIFGHLVRGAIGSRTKP